MLHERERRLPDIGAIILMMLVLMLMFMIIPQKQKMVSLGHIIIAQMDMHRQHLLGNLMRMLLVYLICWAMSGNGPVQSMKAHIMVKRNIVVVVIAGSL